MRRQTGSHRVPGIHRVVPVVVQTVRKHIDTRVRRVTQRRCAWLGLHLKRRSPSHHRLSRSPPAATDTGVVPGTGLLPSTAIERATAAERRRRRRRHRRQPVRSRPTSHRGGRRRQRTQPSTNAPTDRAYRQIDHHEHTPTGHGPAERAESALAEHASTAPASTARADATRTDSTRLDSTRTDRPDHHQHRPPAQTTSPNHQPEPPA